jgi:hypothetical protein
LKSKGTRTGKEGSGRQQITAEQIVEPERIRFGSIFVMMLSAKGPGEYLATKDAA